MALAKQFARKLDNLWRRRTASLRATVIPRGVGQPPKFTRQVRESLINDLLDDATNLLLKKHGRAEFKKVVLRRKLKQMKGLGLLKRARNLLNWAESRIDGPIVYAFWRGNRCLYVGKGESWKRLRSYDHSAYLNAQCIEVFQVTSRSQLGKAECLATHLFNPRDKKVKPAKVKWGKACPICRRHDDVRDKLKTLFKMK